MNGKQFRKYMVYAIGEIILVIIGILIALAINNWNQENQLKSANRALQKKVLAQLTKDIDFLKEFQEDIESLNQTYLKVLGRDYDKAKVNEQGMISTVLFSVNTLSLDKHLNNLIDNATLDNSHASEKMIDINSMYKIYLKDIDDIEAIIYDKMTHNLAVIEETQSWYSELITDFICRNDCINYLLKNEDHKSRIATLRFLYVNGYGSIVEGFHEDLISAKAELEGLVVN
ncbi:hypothetical protein [Psychroserpens mesophilus]|uniref:hypothetical protein n=1 Tax=Psychroserpens mesophilus TaxID=325473 RepID=UPI0006934EBF|nr:hypothetical protein [Psychroserpens mesophilus]